MKPIRDHRQRLIIYGLMWVFLPVLVLAAPVGADIYFWKDDDGVLHFSNRQAPPEAEFYMAAPPPRPHPVVAETQALQEPPAPSKPDALAEANRRLGKALEKVDKLTDTVEQIRREAQAAAISSRQAAEQADREREARERAEAAASAPTAVIVGFPGAHPSKRRDLHPKPGYWRHDTRRYPYYHGSRIKDGPRRQSDVNERFRQPSDVNERFRQPSDFNERFRGPSGFERQFIQRPPERPPLRSVVPGPVRGR